MGSQNSSTRLHRPGEIQEKYLHVYISAQLHTSSYCQLQMELWALNSFILPFRLISHSVGTRDKGGHQSACVFKLSGKVQHREVVSLLIDSPLQNVGPCWVSICHTYCSYKALEWEIGADNLPGPFHLKNPITLHQNSTNSIRANEQQRACWSRRNSQCTKDTIHRFHMGHVIVWKECHSFTEGQPLLKNGTVQKFSKAMMILQLNTSMTC